jgi:hypothetical protein
MDLRVPCILQTRYTACKRYTLFFPFGFGRGITISLGPWYVNEAIYLTMSAWLTF